jgi:hypothetical protein
MTRSSPDSAVLADEIEDSYSGNFVQDILLNEWERKLIVSALRAQAATPTAPAPAVSEDIYAEALRLVRKHMQPGDTVGKMFMRVAKKLDQRIPRELVDREPDHGQYAAQPADTPGMLPEKLRAAELVQSAYDEMCVKFSGVHSDDEMDSVLLRLHAALKVLRSGGVAQPSLTRKVIEKTLCCPKGCARSDDCFVDGPPTRWGRSKHEREQADALVTLLSLPSTNCEGGS